MVKVNLFGNDIVLNKIICIVLDDIPLQVIFDNTKNFKDTSNVCFCNNYRDLCKTINKRKQFIITPITSILSSLTMELGYELLVFSNNQCVTFSTLLNKKEIRCSQNWEKMLYSGCFNLDIPEIRRRDDNE